MMEGQNKMKKIGHVRNKARRGQEEIIGFVMIVVLVAVIFIVFLGITLRNPKPAERKSEMIYQFLDSVMEQTSECALSQGTNYLSVDDLIRECHSSGSECLNGEESCDVLNRTLTEIIDGSWKFGSDYPWKSYEMTGIYTVETGGQVQAPEQVFALGENCSGSLVGNSYFIPQFPGSITITLKLCS